MVLDCSDQSELEETRKAMSVDDTDRHIKLPTPGQNILILWQIPSTSVSESALGAACRCQSHFQWTFMPQNEDFLLFYPVLVLDDKLHVKVPNKPGKN